MGKRVKEKKEFSKVLLVQESILIWVSTLALIGLAYVCVLMGFTGSLPWLSAMVGLPWAAYGFSQVYYYKKSTAENTKDGIKYDSVMTELEKTYLDKLGQITTPPTFIDNDLSFDDIYLDDCSGLSGCDEIDIDYGI